MVISTSKTDLLCLLDSQVEALLGKKEDFSQWIDDALARIEYCFSRIRNKYYRDAEGNVLFDPMHSGQYTIFLYFLANTIYIMGGEPDLSKKLYYLNKILHSVDWYYEIELPNYFGVEHPLGSVLGRARYSDGLFVYQGCTVGGSGGVYPKLGKGVIMNSNASILGKCQIGNNVVLSTHCVVLNQDIPDNSIVFGMSPNLSIINKTEEYISRKYIGNFFS
jgi:serine O-acetyltransferase